MYRKGEDYRNQEAPYTNVDLGVNDCKYAIDVNSPRFCRERSPLPGHKRQDDAPEAVRRRRPARQHEEDPGRQQQDVTDTDTSPDVPQCHGDKPGLRYRLPLLMGLYLLSFTLFVSALVYFFIQDLERVLVCSKSRYQAVVYNERGVLYHLCRFLNRFTNKENENKHWRNVLFLKGFRRNIT